MKIFHTVPKYRDYAEFLSQENCIWARTAAIPCTTSPTHKAFWLEPDVNWGLGRCMDPVNRRLAPQVLEHFTENFEFFDVSSIEGYRACFVMQHGMSWAHTLSTIETHLLSTFPGMRGRTPRWEIDRFVRSWRETAQVEANARQVSVENFVLTQTRRDHPVVGPVKIRVTFDQGYDHNVANFQLYSSIVVSERWFSLNSAGRFPIIAPTFGVSANLAAIEELSRAWKTWQTGNAKKVRLPAGYVKFNILSLFTLAEIETGAKIAFDLVDEKENAESLAVRRVAAKILATFKRPFLFFDEGALIEVLQQREEVGISIETPTTDLLQQFPSLAYTVDWPLESWKNRLVTFCRKVFDRLYCWANSLSENQYLIPHELLMCLERPEALTLSPFCANFIDGASSASVRTNLMTDNDQKVIWLIVKAKDVLINIVPETLDPSKIEDAVRFLDQLVSVARDDEEWVMAAEDLRAAARSRNNENIARVWSKIFKTLTEEGVTESEHVRVFKHAAKKGYHELIVSNLVRILIEFEVGDFLQCLSCFTRAFGRGRIIFFKKVYNKEPDWRFDSHGKDDEKVYLSSEEIFKQGRIKDNPDQPSWDCVFKYCKESRGAVKGCDFHINGMTDAVHDGDYSPVSFSPIGEKAALVAYERWNKRSGWRNVKPKLRLRYLRESLGLLLVDAGINTEITIGRSFDFSSSPTLTQNMMMRLDTGTTLTWSDDQVKENSRLFKSWDDLQQNWESISAMKDWQSIFESDGMIMLIELKEVSSAMRVYGDITWAYKKDGKTTVESDISFRMEDETALRLRQLQSRIRDVSQTLFSASIGNNWADLFSMACQQQKDADIKLAFVVHSQEAFDAVAGMLIEVEETTQPEISGGMAVLLQEKAGDNGPDIIRCSRRGKTSIFPRPCATRDSGDLTLPPNTIEDADSWSYLVSALNGEKREELSPENWISSLLKSFKRDSNEDLVKRQKKGIDLFLAISEWCKLGIQNQLGFMDTDFQPLVDPPRAASDIQPEDVTPMFEEPHMTGEMAQKRFAMKIFGRRSTFAFTNNLGDYGIKNFVRLNADAVGGLDIFELLWSEFEEAGLKCGNGGLSAFDLDILLSARRGDPSRSTTKNVIGRLGWKTWEEEGKLLWGPKTETPDADRAIALFREEHDIGKSEEDEFFSFLPRRFHHQIDWEEQAVKNRMAREDALIHDEVKKALKYSQEVDNLGASLHPRMRGWIQFFREARPKNIAAPFGIPTIDLLTEFQERVDFHTEIDELIDGTVKLRFNPGQKNQKGKKGAPTDARLGATLPDPPKGRWVNGRCIYAPFQDRGTVSYRAKDIGKGRLLPKEEAEKLITTSPAPWADLLNAHMRECFRNMVAMGITKDSQIVTDGKAYLLDETEKERIKFLAKVCSDLSAEENSRMDSAKELAEKVVQKPGPVSEHLKNLHFFVKEVIGSRVRKSIFNGLEAIGKLGQVTTWSAGFYPLAHEDF